MTRLLPRALSRIFHFNTPYRFGNSAAGSRAAQRAGFTFIDQDGQLTRDEIPIVAHWHRFDWDGFTHWINPDTNRLERHPYKRGEQYRHLTYAQVCRLRDKTGRDSVASFANLAAFNARIGLNMNYEVKDDPRWASARIAAKVRASTEAARRVAIENHHPGWHVRIMTLSNLGDAKGRLKAFHLAGFETIVLARGPIPRSWEPWISYVRGSWTRAKG